MSKNQTLLADGLHLAPANCNPKLALVLRPAAHLLLAGVILASLLQVPVQAQAVRWKTDEDFQQQLQAGIGIRWAGVSLRDALTRLSANQEVAIFLDRRVDPDQPIEFATSTIALESLLQGVAAHIRQGTCHVGDVVYLGPPQTAAVLATVIALKQDETERLPATIRARLQRREALRWPMLSTPRGLIQGLADEVGLRVVGLDTIPHDLWPAVDLPPLTFAQRMGLVLAGFQLTFEYAPDGSAVRFLPLPEQAVVQRSYPLRPAQSTLARGLTQRIPGIQVSIAASQITITGTWQQHEQVQRLLQGRRPEPRPGQVPEGETLFTLRIENKPVQAVAAVIAARIDRELSFDPAIANKSGELVSFDVQEVTLDKLLRTLLEPVGLSYELDQAVLRVIPGR